MHQHLHIFGQISEFVPTMIVTNAVREWKGYTVTLLQCTLCGKYCRT